MSVELHVVMFCKTETVSGDKQIVFARAYKYLDKPKNFTSTCRHFVYSYKAKRYVMADFYIVDWKGWSLHGLLPERDLWRWSLRRIGLDIR